MDFMSSFTDQDPFSEDETTSDTIQHNYVRWQSSQTPCHALNKLIDSSSKHSKDSSRSSRIWQREPSFDQIPGFSLLSTTDRPPLSSTPTIAKDSSSKPASSSRPRPRPSEARARSRSATTVAQSADSSTSNTIPFLDRTNPAVFLDILKGVSAKVDANVGARARANLLESRYSSRIEKAKKRGRSGSVGNGPEALALKAKRTRMESLRLARDKGKGRAIDNGDFEDDNTQNPREHNAMPNLTTTSRAALTSADSWVDKSLMDIDDGDKSMADISSDTMFANSFRPGLAKTPSQASMPPPPAPMTKHPTALNNTPSRNNASTSTSTAPFSNYRSEAPHKDLKGSDSRPQDRTPRYHPLLLQQEANKSSSSGQNQPHANINRVLPQQQSTSMKTSPTQRAPKAEPTSGSSSAKSKQDEAPLLVSTTVAGNQSTRPPALGMRRTHTLPSAVMVPSITPGAMPTKQKAFKPPSMSSSQPQSFANNNPAPMTKGPSAYNQPSYRQSNIGSRAPPSGSNGSTSSESPSARGYVSSSSYSSTPNTNTPASSASHKPSRTPASIAREEAIAKALQEAAAASQAQSQTRCRGPQQPPRLRTAPAPPAPAPPPPPPPAAEPITIPRPASPVLPEPTNGDGDSSFGDISFDMDALEETMRQYD